MQKQNCCIAIIKKTYLGSLAASLVAAILEH